MVKNTLTVLMGISPGARLKTLSPLPASWQKLLSRALWSEAGLSAEQTLLQLTGQSTDVSMAALSWSGDDMPETGKIVLRADPVCLIPNREHLTMMPGDQLRISLAEATALIEALNEHFREDPVSFEFSTPDCWYCCCDTRPDISSVPLPQAAGRNLQTLLWQGADKAQWHSWWNEIQMLFHSHPVNMARESQGLPAINGLWFWGEGSQPVKRQHSDMTIFTDSRMGHGLVNFAAADRKSVSGDFAMLADYGSDKAVLDLVDDIEVDFASLGDALINWLRKSGDRQLKIVIDGAGSYTLRPGMLKKFWRRRVQGIKQQGMKNDA